MTTCLNNPFRVKDIGKNRGRKGPHDLKGKNGKR
nr:MAG TPA: hypothetical protein [Caudoviricetes sp.]